MKEWKNILLVEDNPRDRELTLETLKEINLINEIIAVSDGEEALDYLLYKGKYTNRSKILPAVILLDLKMPKLSGIDVLKIIKNDPNLKYIPVVILTSSKEEIDLQNCYEYNVNAYVVKPVGYAEFVEAVKNVGLFWGIVNETFKQ